MSAGWEVSRRPSGAAPLPGFQVDVHTGGDGAHAITVTGADLALLDGDGLPDLDLPGLCERIRDQHQTLPILLTSAPTGQVDPAVALNHGATDYLPKTLPP